MDRRNFIALPVTTAIGASIVSGCGRQGEASQGTPTAERAEVETPTTDAKPTVISTWEHGLAANAAAWEILSVGGSALDAAEAGVRVTEADPEVTSVGLGGLPDRDGKVTVDACIMGPDGDCGSVAFLQDILHPVSVARRVMEETPHVMLVGTGARDFALAQGFTETPLLTREAEVEWRQWLRDGASQQPAIDADNHDTIGLLALDQSGDLAGACTTSGAKFKLHGRVGDSPLIGAGLYVDNEVGAATATGWGEAVIRAVGCFLVVELMRQGRTAQGACEEAVERVISKNRDWRQIQVGFIALAKDGSHGGYCIDRGFEFALQTEGSGNRLLRSNSRL